MPELVVLVVIGFAALLATIIVVFWAMNLSSSVHAIAAAVARMEADQVAATSESAADAPDSEVAASTPIEIEPFVD